MTRSFFRTLSVLTALAFLQVVASNGQSPSPNPAGLLARRYQDGQVLRYEMKGKNQGWEYTIQATDTTRRDAQGRFYEEIGWSGMKSNAPMQLSADSLALRQTVSLEDPATYMRVPDLSHVQPFLIGPITDFLTFASDRMMVMRHNLGPEQPHAYVPHGKPNSWADGQHFTEAQDAIDFDLSFQGEDKDAHTATVQVRHVPPEHPQVQLPAQWMRTPVAGTPNNWVQVSHDGSGFLAEVGQEIFAVTMVIDTRDGKVLSARMENPVTAVSRHCMDAALEDCTAATPETIRREVSLTLLP